MLAFLFFVVILIQIAAYKLIDIKRIIDGRIFILILILLMYIIVFPMLFKPTAPEVEGSRCGLPVIAFMMRFWIFGTLITLLTHIIYFVVNGKEKIYPDD